MNGTTCCLIRACCPESEQRAALAKEIAAAWHADPGVADGIPNGQGGDAAKSAADFILDHFDLVPKGVGAAIVDGFRPFLKEFKRAEGGAGG